MSVEAKPGYNVALIRDDMALRGWLPTHLAKRTRLTDQSISRFLKGEAQSAPTAKKIAKALGYSVRRYLIHASREHVA